MWDDTDCPLSPAYMNDLATLGSLVDLGVKIKVPWLLVHGTEDDVVPIQDSIDIFAKASSPAEFLQIKGSNHVFGGEYTMVMVQRVVNWLAVQIVGDN